MDMDFICVCKSCRKTIQKDFFYCPWCGTENAEPSDKAILENVFGQLEVKQALDRDSRVKKIETKIAEIEEELNHLDRNGEVIK